tara:strand:+ start:2053 stop:2973 length:921 start_codon:yes stop_codon:yes gene_type:complete
MARSKRTEKQIRNKKATKFDYVGDKKTESRLQEIEIYSSTIENIDKAMLNYIDERLNIFVESNTGFKKVPVLWVTAERSYQIKHNKDLRDKEETLILPLITVDRKGIEKNPNSDYAIPAANIPEVRDAMGGAITIGRRIYQKKTAEFQNATAKRRFGYSTWPAQPAAKTVYKTISIPFPTWVAVNYQISLRAEYQQQMNTMMTKFANQGGLNRMPFRLQDDKNKYEAFIDGSFANNSNVMSLDMAQRNYETLINIKVLGYLIGDEQNQEKPKIVERENAVEVKIPRERVILGDTPEFPDSSGFYRE